MGCGWWNRHANACLPGPSITPTISETKPVAAASGQSRVARLTLMVSRGIAINCGRKPKPGLIEASSGGWKQPSLSKRPRPSKRTVTKKIHGRNSLHVGLRTGRVRLSEKCSRCVLISRGRSGRNRTRTASHAAFKPWVGSVTANAKERGWNGDIAGWRRKCSQCSQSCSRSVPS